VLGRRGPEAAGAPGPHPRFRYYPLVMAAFVTVLLCSNLIGPGKSCAIDLHAKLIPQFTTAGFAWTSLLVFGAGNLFFPFSYIFDDVLTEVYGYAQARKVIWAGFGATVFSAIMAQVVISLPVNTSDEYSVGLDPAIRAVFGHGPRIILASILAFWAGDFANSYVLAKMKILTRGRWLWTRTIGSTIVGEGLDSLIFYPLALTSWQPLLRAVGVTNPAILDQFGGWSADTMLRVVTFNWVFKVLVEVAMTPVTYLVCGWLKRAEGVDHYDVDTNFTPFSLRD
jgi:uncharacterized integral membrane protein (TIGR00697 family)